MSCYMSTRNISSKSMHVFLSNLARQTDRQRQTNAGKRIYLLLCRRSKQLLSDTINLIIGSYQMNYNTCQPTSLWEFCVECANSKKNIYKYSGTLSSWGPWTLSTLVNRLWRRWNHPWRWHNDSTECDCDDMQTLLWSTKTVVSVIQSVFALSMNLSNASL